MSDVNSSSTVLSNAKSSSKDLNTNQKELKLSCSKEFTQWLRGNNLSLAFTNSRLGKVFLLGTTSQGEISLFDRTLDNPSAIHYANNELFIATSYQLWRFHNTLSVSQAAKEDYDCLFTPRESHVTGEIGITSLAIANDSSLLFTTPLFSTVATTSPQYNFKSIWKPPFISSVTPENRCYLNGMGVHNGELKYASAWSEGDTKFSWMFDYKNKGVVIDTVTNEIVCRDLTLPGTLKIEDDKLWLAQSGTGFIGTIDPIQKVFQPLIFCPGYISAFELTKGFAVVALSRPMNNDYKKWELGEQLKKRDIEPWCGIFIIDLKLNKLVHWFRMEGLVNEVNDLTLIDGYIKPSLIGFRNDQVKKTIAVG